jgi:hypothetical protein
MPRARGSACVNAEFEDVLRIQQLCHHRDGRAILQVTEYVGVRLAWKIGERDWVQTGNILYRKVSACPGS